MARLTEDERRDLKEALARIDTEIDITLGAIARATTPVIEGQKESTKTLTTLASGALILSTSITQVVAPRVLQAGITLRWPGLLPASWGLFGAVVILAAFRIRWVQGVESQAIGIENVRANAHDFIRTRPSKESMYAYIDDVVGPAYSAVGKDALSYHRRLNLSQLATAWMFAGGMVSLLTFAIANLRW